MRRRKRVAGAQPSLVWTLLSRSVRDSRIPKRARNVLMAIECPEPCQYQFCQQRSERFVDGRKLGEQGFGGGFLNMPLPALPARVGVLPGRPCKQSARKLNSFRIARAA